MTRGFRVLFHEFFSQFFASESATSDQQLRVAIIGALAFLVTPGFLIPFQLSGRFEYAAIVFPALLEPLTELVATVFIAYTMVSIGMVAMFVWDSLTFDRRDAMVIGPLPVTGTTVVLAKLAALGAFLLAAAAISSTIGGIPFAMIASAHKSLLVVGRHIVAHMAATMCAAAFVFCALVTLRSLIGMARVQSVVLPTLLQFALVSGMLCFVVLAQTTIHLDRLPGGLVVGVHLTPVPAWSPTNWFLGLYETLRGSARPDFALHTTRAIWFTLAAVAAAALSTLAAYRRQFQLALAPSAWTQSARGTRALRAAARVFAGRDAIARATTEFMINTIVRNRAQQVPVAINAAIGMAMLVIMATRLRGVPATVAASALVRASLLLGYWTIIGLRASFFVPAELQAAWVFNANAPASNRAYWSATRAAMLSIVVMPIAVVMFAGIGFLRGWQTGLWQAMVVAALLVCCTDVIAATISRMPFAHPYPPGHAKLKSRWPFYLLGVFMFVIFPIHMRIWSPSDTDPWAIGVVLALMVIAHAVSRSKAGGWTIELPRESNDEESEITTLDIAFVERGAL